MTIIEQLLDILLREMINAEKQTIRDNVTYSLCMNSMRGVSPKEIDSTKTSVVSMDDKRYYVAVTMKDSGRRLVVPLDKRHITKCDSKRIGFFHIK